MGSVIFQRTSGSKFFANTLLGSFCPECVNLASVSILPDITEVRTPTKLGEPTTETSNSIDPEKKAYMIATYVLASLLFLLIICSILCLVKLRSFSKDATIKSGPS